MIRKPLITAALLLLMLGSSRNAEAQFSVGAGAQQPSPTLVRRGLFGRRAYYVDQQPTAQCQASPQTTPPDAATQPREAVAATDARSAFLAWLNAQRASCGLQAVQYSEAVEADCHQNNLQQAARGMNHWHMGCHRRQNAAWNLGFPGVESAWLGSPGHASALLDPTIQFVGIAWLNGYCTFGAY